MLNYLTTVFAIVFVVEGIGLLLKAAYGDYTSGLSEGKKKFMHILDGLALLLAAFVMYQHMV